MRLRYRDWDWRALDDAALDDAALDDLEAALRTIFDDFPIGGSPNESQTVNDLIWPVLERLGWTASLQQQNLSATGREDVPDGLQFADMATKDRANRFAQDCKRYGLGLAVVESKRWLRPLDRRSGQHGEETAPSNQMLRYLRRIDDLTTGNLRWGFLTYGARWRLYYQGARSVSEQFFEVDLAAVLDLPGYNDVPLRSHRTGSAPLARSSRWPSVETPFCQVRLSIGVGPLGRTVSGGRFDRLAGLFLLDAVGAQVAEGRV